MNVLGTKCICDVCQVQLVVIRDGRGTLTCHGQPVRVVAGGAAGSEQRRSVANSTPGADDDDTEYF